MDQGEDQDITIENKNVSVERVHVIGLNNTKKDYINSEIGNVLKSKTFLEVYNNAIRSRDTMMKKGVFKNVEVFIDTTEAYENHKNDGVQVLFKVQELSRVVGEARTQMSASEQPSWVLRIMAPNLGGRGEKAVLSFSHAFGNKSVCTPDDFDLTFSKPLLNKNTNIGSVFNLSANQTTHQCPWASYNQLAKGVSAGWDFNVLGNTHRLEAHAQWRELQPTEDNGSMDVRRQSGHSVKTSLLHSFCVNRLDDLILPTKGSYFKINEELGIYNGKSAFVKEQIQLKLVRTLLNKMTFEVSSHLGAIVPLSSFEDINISDKFFIGGPMSMRGFEYNSIGPCNNKAFTGSWAYWLLGGHLYTPLPFVSSGCEEPSWSQAIRLHFFFNSGNCVNPKTLVENGPSALFNNTRLSCGFGVAYNLMKAARVELNFCYPISAKKSDKTSDGLQFGIGVSTC